MKVVVCADEGAAGGCALRCSAADRKISVERGEGANRKIVFSSTFDTVLVNPAADSCAEQLHEAAVAAAVTSCLEGKLGVVLCIGNQTGKRAKLWQALCDHSVPALFAAAREQGARITASAVHLHWEQLTDLLNSNAIDQAPPNGHPGGLWGSSTQGVDAPAEAVKLLQALPAAAANAEVAMVGSAGGGHLAVQLQLSASPGSTAESSGGRLLFVDVAGHSTTSTGELLSSTLCHTSHTMLNKVLSKPAARPPTAEMPLLTRLLSPLFDAHTATTSAARLILFISSQATQQETVDLLRTAQAAGGKIVKSKKDKGGSDQEARQASVVDVFQRTVKELRDPPSPTEVESLLRTQVGDASGLQADLAAAVADLAVVQEALAAAKAEGGGEASAGAAEAEAEAQMTAWAANEDVIGHQLAAERAEAEALLQALNAASKDAPETPRGGPAPGGISKTALREQVDKYEKAVESAWSAVQRAQQEAEETESRFDRAREVARRSAAEKEEMESTLLDVAADLENLARNYRQHGSPAMAVPLYVSALAIFEKTLGPEHPQVASNLVNLGNAFCDQQKHIDAVPVYLRALAIDEKALGHDHPEVAMDLSNLGIAYRALGRADIASGLFERAHKLMLAAVGPDDPKTKAIVRNLS